MLPLLISGITDIITKVLGSVLPETPEEKLAEIRAAIDAQLADNELLKAQIAVDQQEAASSSLFVAGWRPAVGWICAFAFAWQFLCLPILLFIGSVLGHAIPVPTFDVQSMLVVLSGLLGLGGMRTYEKVNKASR